MITNEILLIFFAIPIAVVIISIALQKIFRNPILVAAIIFAIFLIVTFAVGNIQLLVAAIAYAILSYITAILTYIICRFLKEQKQCCPNLCTNNNNNINSNNNLATINEISDELLRQNVDNFRINNNGLSQINALSNGESQNCCCNNSNEVSGVNGISARINIIPNNNGTSGGTLNGCYRRR